MVCGLAVALYQSWYKSAVSWRRVLEREVVPACSSLRLPPHLGCRGWLSRAAPWLLNRLRGGGCHGAGAAWIASARVRKAMWFGPSRRPTCLGSGLPCGPSDNGDW